MASATLTVWFFERRSATTNVESLPAGHRFAVAVVEAQEGCALRALVGDWLMTVACGFGFGQQRVIVFLSDSLTNSLKFQHVRPTRLRSSRASS
jgi:hypothetical protein